MDIKIIQNDKWFAERNCPTMESLGKLDCEFKFPCLVFGHTYYRVYKGSLTQFRILAYAVKSRLTTQRNTCLSFWVQLPGMQPQWIDEFITKDTPIFNSKEEFLYYQVNGTGKLELHWTEIQKLFPSLCDNQFFTLRNKTWQWCPYQCKPICDFAPHIKNIFVSQHGLFINVATTHYSNRHIYLNKEDCVKAQLDGLGIVEFADEAITIDITILPSTKKVHVLRFQEEDE